MSTSAPDPLAQAADLLLIGQLSEARAALARYLSQNPESAEGWYLLSRAVIDPAQQRDCLERALRLDPDHLRAAERLAELNAPPPAARPRKASPTSALQPAAEPPPASPPRPAPPAPAVSDERASGATTETIQSLRAHLAVNQAEAAAHAPPPAVPLRRQFKLPANWRLLVWLGGGVVLALILYAVWVVVLPAVLYPVPAAVTVLPTFTATPVLFPTLPPEWTATPEPLATVTAPPTPTRVLTATPTFPAPDATQAAAMEAVASQVAVLRDLEIMGEVPRYLLPRDQVPGVLAGLVLDEELRAALEAEAQVLAALGLVPPGYDLAQYALNNAADSVGGFYIPWLRQLFVIGEAFGGVERFVFAHEMTHALQDQHFAIDDLGVYPYCTSNAQTCDAIRALIEGDATLVMGQWLEQFAAPEDVQDIAAYDPPNQTVPEESPPPYIVQDLSFPYDRGAAFVTFLYQRGNWGAVNAAYDDLPASTEQILHPEKYVAGELPVVVTDPPLAEALPSGWRLLQADVLGEWTTYLLLGYGARQAAQVPEETAARAAAGWGGDRYQAYVEEASGKVVLAVHWAWDSEAEADEFWEAMLAYQAGRFEIAPPDTDGRCWMSVGEVSCVYATSQETLWLLAPTEALAGQVLALFPSFQ